MTFGPLLKDCAAGFRNRSEFSPRLCPAPSTCFGKHQGNQTLETLFARNRRHQRSQARIKSPLLYHLSYRPRPWGWGGGRDAKRVESLAVFSVERSIRAGRGRTRFPAPWRYDRQDRQRWLQQACRMRWSEGGAIDWRADLGGRGLTWGTPSVARSESRRGESRTVTRLEWWSMDVRRSFLLT